MQISLYWFLISGIEYDYHQRHTRHVADAAKSTMWVQNCTILFLQ